MSTTPKLPDALSASNLDTIPVLTSILSRAQPPTGNTSSTPLLQTGATPSGSASFTSQPASSHVSQSQLRPDATGQLSIKEVPSATDGLKYRLQRARIEATKLPGIIMSIAEQEAEIRMWEEKIGKQREQLENLRKLGEKMVAGAGELDVVMGGVLEK